MLSPAMAPTSAVIPRIQRFGSPLWREKAANATMRVSLGTTMAKPSTKKNTSRSG
ncbi:hypothetical protein D3C85_1842390 [compost metagenome]